MITKVRGTQDIIDLKLFKDVIKKIRFFFEKYHFQEIATPVLEHVELFKRSLGLETDIVTKEMFVIEQHEDKKEHERICLRPEGTASIMRAFLEHGAQHTFVTPWKVFLCGPMFRHERPQKGRYRQFNQCSIEMLGTSSIWHDIEMLTMLDRLFSHIFNVTDYVLHINFLGCIDDRVRYNALFLAFVNKHSEQLCATCMRRKETNILRMLDCKQEKCQALYAQAPLITDHLCEHCAQEWQLLQKNLAILSVTFSHNPYLVRGLDYYDKTVFEFLTHRLGAQSAFCAGGRYNGLAEQLGAKQTVPAIGAAIGIDRLLLLLEDGGYQLTDVPKPVHICIPLGEEQYPLALLIADQLRVHGHCVDVLVAGESIKKMMQKADKMGAKTVLIIGPDEQKNNMVTIKNLIDGKTDLINQGHVASFYAALD